MKFEFGGQKSLVLASKIEKNNSKIWKITEKYLSLQRQGVILGYPVNM